MNRHQIVSCIIIILVGWMLFPVASEAQVPQKINFQGLLQDTSGNPVSGTLNMAFSIYDVSTGGTSLWSETQSVTVTNGLYSVLLGEITPINLTAPAQYYLGIQVDINPEMTPRRELASVMSALFASQVEGITVSNGNVGIGTTNPTQKLSVDGTVLAKKVLVSIDAADWPDYVFEQELAPLSEVEKYVNEHKHLPGIPSAEEVAQEGMDVAEMQIKQLQLSEELMLRLIEMKRTMTVLQQQQQLLQQQNTLLQQQIEILFQENNLLKQQLSATSQVQ